MAKVVELKDNLEPIETKESTQVNEQAKENKLEQAVIFVYKSCEQGQAHSGAFTMQSCKDMRTARDKLIKVFREMPEFVESDIGEAYAVLYKGTEMQQAKGVFTMDGSIKLLEFFVEIETWIKAHRSAKWKLAELKKARAAEE